MSPTHSPIARNVARNGAPAATRTRDPRLLRNYPLELLSGFEIDERAAKGGGALAQTAEHARATVRVIGGSPGVVVHEAVFERAVDENGEFR